MSFAPVPTSEIVDLLVGLIIPLLVAMVTKVHAPSWAKAVVNLGLSAATGVLSALVGATHVDWRTVGMLILTTWVASMASYKGFHAPTGIAAAVAEATRAFGLTFGATLHEQTHPTVTPSTVPPTIPPPASTVPVGVRRRLEQLPAPHPTGKMLGRLPRGSDPRDLTLTRYLEPAALPAPPSARTWITGVSAWPMLLNDRIGDCTIAAALHMVQAWAAAAGNPAYVPTDAAALTAYEQITGYTPDQPGTDLGAVERDVLAAWRGGTVGGHRILAFAAVDPGNVEEIRTAISLFGGLYAGFALPAGAQGMDNWTIPTSGDTPGSWGGHAVPILGYDPRGFDIVSWGRPMRATRGFVTRYCEELWAVISPDWMDAAGVSPDGLRLADLTADLAALPAPARQVIA